MVKIKDIEWADKQCTSCSVFTNGQVMDAAYCLLLKVCKKADEPQYFHWGCYCSGDEIRVHKSEYVGIKDIEFDRLINHVEIQNLKHMKYGTDHIFPKDFQLWHDEFDSIHPEAFTFAYKEYKGDVSDNVQNPGYHIGGNVRWAIKHGVKAWKRGKLLDVLRSTWYTLKWKFIKHQTLSKRPQGWWENKDTCEARFDGDWCYAKNELINLLTSYKYHSWLLEHAQIVRIENEARLQWMIGTDFIKSLTIRMGKLVVFDKKGEKTYDVDPAGLSSALIDIRKEYVLWEDPNGNSLYFPSRSKFPKKGEPHKHYKIYGKPEVYLWLDNEYKKMDWVD